VKAFADRDEAGLLLGQALAGLDPAPGPGALVLGIPRGGVIVAAAAARVIGADLDVLVPAKVRAPHQPELAIGAVGPDGGVWLDRAAVAALAIPDAVLDAQVRAAWQEVLRRTAAFRGDRPPPSVSGRFVVLVDDGIATGATIAAAARALRAQAPARLVVAVPVAPGQILYLRVGLPAIGLEGDWPFGERERRFVRGCPSGDCGEQDDQRQNFCSGTHISSCGGNREFGSCW